MSVKGHDESSLRASHQPHFLNPTIQSGSHQGEASGSHSPALTAAGTSDSNGGLVLRSGRTISPAVLRVIYFGSIFCFISGVLCGNLGGWFDSVVGFLGMFLITVGVITTLFVAYHRYHQRHSAGGAGTNLTIRPTVTLQQEVTNPSGDGGTTSYVIETRRVQTTGMPIGPQGFNTQCGFPQGTTTQTFQDHMQNVPGPTQPPPSNTPSGGYPQPIPTDPTGTFMTSQGATPQFNYPVMHPPQIRGTHLGVTQPDSVENDLPPPPSYQDVFSKSY